MGFQLDPASLGKLTGVHPDLVKVVQDCAANNTLPFDFGISQGVRTLEQEKKYVAAGRSQTLHSRHLDGHAVDLVVLLRPDHEICWTTHLYETLAVEMFASAKKLGIPIEYGGGWLNLKDYCHYQLPWAQYPSAKSA